MAMVDAVLAKCIDRTVLHLKAESFGAWCGVLCSRHGWSDSLAIAMALGHPLHCVLFERGNWHTAHRAKWCTVSAAVSMPMGCSSQVSCGSPAYQKPADTGKRQPVLVLQLAATLLPPIVSAEKEGGVPFSFSSMSLLLRVPF